MLGKDRRTMAEAVLLLVGAVLVLGGMNGDPLGVGSSNFYKNTGLGLIVGMLLAEGIEQPRQALFVGSTIAVGLLVVGLGSLPLSHPLTDPLVVGGTTVAEDGVVAVVGVLLFGLGIGWVLVRAKKDDYA